MKAARPTKMLNFILSTCPEWIASSTIVSICDDAQSRAAGATDLTEFVKIKSAIRQGDSKKDCLVNRNMTGNHLSLLSSHLYGYTARPRR